MNAFFSSVLNLPESMLLLYMIVYFQRAVLLLDTKPYGFSVPQPVHCQSTPWVFSPTVCVLSVNTMAF